MAGTFDKPTIKATPTAFEFGTIAANVLDAALTETTVGHREDGFAGGEPAEPAEFNYIFQRNSDWQKRNAAALVGEHRVMSVVIGGAVTTGDTRRLTVSSPSAFTVDYVTQAADTTNADIAANFALAIVNDAVASLFLTASISGSTVIVEWLDGLAIVTMTAATTVGAGTTTPTQTVGDTDMLIRIADDSGFNNGSLVVGSTSLSDIGPTGDTRVQFSVQDGSFRAGTANAAEWDFGSRGDDSAGFGLNNTVTGAQAFCAGNASSVSGQSSVGLGNTNTVQNDNGVAIGRSNTVQSDDDVAIGRSNTIAPASADSWAMGLSNVIGAGSSMALGDSNDLQFANCYALGERNIPSAAQSVAVGFENLPGSSAFAFGHSNTPSGAQSVAVGVDNTPAALQSVAIGHACQAAAAAANAITIGDEAAAVWPSEICHNSGGKNTTVGDVRGHIHVLNRKTTTAAVTAMYVGGIGDTMTLLASTTYTYTAMVSAYVTGGAGGNINKGYGAELRGAVRVNAASAVIDLGTSLTAFDVEALGYSVGIDVTTARLRITVTGAATDNVNWAATLHVAECGGVR